MQEHFLVFCNQALKFFEVLNPKMIWKLSVLAFLLSFSSRILGEDILNIHKSLNVENCGKKFIKTNTDRIIGGDRARHGNNPWMVALFGRYDDWRHDEDFGFLCGGAILNENWIVTAASCFNRPDKPWIYFILTGLYKLSETDGPTVRKYKVSEIIIHSNFSSYYEYMYNIALVKLQKPIDFKASKGYANAICLPKDTEESAGFATTVGWGRTEASVNKLSDALSEIMVPIIPSALCPNYGNNICAGGKGKNFCYNDGGSPLFQEDYHSTSTLIGVASSGYYCGTTNDPGKYTRMSMYLEWMSEVIAEK